MDQPILEDVLRNAQSADVDVRAQGIHSLSILVQKGASLSERALPIFRAALAQPVDGWTVSNALRGVRKLAGEAEYHATATEIANYSEAKLASRVVLMLDDPSFADDLIELMRRRPDSEIQIATMRTLGRMRAPDAFDPVAANLLKTELRPHAIESLGDLGDARAIPYLQPLLGDRTEAWQEDNHGPMLSVGDLAQNAILKLSAASPGAAAVEPPPAPAITPMPAATGAAVLSPGAGSVAPLPYVSPPPATMNKLNGSVMQHLLPFVPLALAIFQIPWILMVIFGIVVFHDDLKSQAATRLFDLVAMTPGLIGLLVGVIAVIRWPAPLSARICLILGMIGCALPQFSFGYELFH